MGKGKKYPSDSAELRFLAEERLRSENIADGACLPKEESQRLIHELQVHQIELEMQNDELRQARLDEAAALEKYTDPLGKAGSERAALTAPESLSLKTIPAKEGERIQHLLLVEDDPTIRQVLGSMLKLATNYTFDFAEDGLKAVEMWEKGEYDLVLMDVQMPQLDGFEVTRAIRKQERERGGHTPIIAMTAYASKEDEERCLAAGMDAFISKPVNFGETLQVIREIIKLKVT